MIERGLSSSLVSSDGAGAMLATVPCSAGDRTTGESKSLCRCGDTSRSTGSCPQRSAPTNAPCCMARSDKAPTAPPCEQTRTGFQPALSSPSQAGLEKQMVLSDFLADRHRNLMDC